MDRGETIQLGDWLLLGLFSLILFGFAGFSGRPLTMHEARLPETSREMLHHHQWLLPTSGGRPWLERPPLPHWLVIGAMKLFGGGDQFWDRVWVVRLPSAVMGMLTVLISTLIARRWFGRTVGLLSGYLLATSFKFYQYSTLAEDDIYLGFLVALAAAFFSRAEFKASSCIEMRWDGLNTDTPWTKLAFFLVLGISNLTKGPLLGILILGSAIGGYCVVSLIRQRSISSIRRYFWLWGFLVISVLTLAWPLWAYHRYPDVLDNWKYDYLGRMSGDYTAINEPWWYYPPKLAVGLLPWTPVALVGLLVLGILVWPGRTVAVEPVKVQASSWRQFLSSVRARGDATSNAGPQPLSGYWWVLCWAIVPLLVLSIPKGKHDHYLVPFLAPWAMISALGLVQVGAWVNAGRRTMWVILILLGLGYCGGEAFIAPGTDHTVDDTAFLLRCRGEVPADAPLFIDAKLGPPGNLDFFRMQFYSRPDAVLLHNLSFLRDEKIKAAVVYVIARQRDLAILQQLGDAHQVDQSPRSHDMDKPAGRFTLYRLVFKAGLQRYPAPTAITSLQAMERAPGPWCGPPLQ